MYVEVAIFALFIFLYSLVAGRIESSKAKASGPMVFVCAGLFMGPLGMGLLGNDVTVGNLRVLADLTLALFLFIDAANTNFMILKRQFRIPFRMLFFGLPGSIFLGTLLASLLFDVLSIYEAVVLGTMLAATDAALGKAVITNKKVPAQIREGLNIESGLNDGICVPILLVFVTLASASNVDGGGVLALKLVSQEIGIGLLVGFGFTAIAIWLFDLCASKGWISDIWVQITVVALSVACFASAQSLHGSGYIAAFSGGLLFGYNAKQLKHKLVHTAEGIGETLALTTWFLFGAIVVGQSFKYLTWAMFIYTLLSLTVIRMLPIYISLSGLGESNASKLFLGWFGPRGLASIVFAIIVINESLPSAHFMALVVVLTVFSSLIAHGVSANPLTRWIAEKENKEK